MYLGDRAKGQGQYKLKIFYMARYNSSYIFDGGCLYTFVLGTMVADNKSF